MPLAMEQNKGFNLVNIGLFGTDTVVLYPYPAIAAIELIHVSDVFVQDLSLVCADPGMFIA